MSDIMKNQSYTVAKLQMYDECPQKYKLCYIDKVHIPEKLDKSASQKGNNIHNLINYYLKGQDVSKIIQSLNNSEKELWINFKNSEIKNYQTLKSEYAFNVKVDEYWLTGRIDALCRHNDEYIILDWKTGENFSGQNVNFQTSFYLFSMFEILKSLNFIKDVQQLSLHYINLAINNTIKIQFDDDKLLNYKTKILDIINKINSDSYFYCTKTDKCKNCKYARACIYY